ncbi:hypothetical protein FQN57_004186 [Myotisia sp. PD_48]|nr:hypothetical protein FQN57_004186 [Myotisia sp. PD_48]
MTNVGAGPWSAYEDFFRTRLQSALQKADHNQFIQGWHANGVRNRLDNFIVHGLHTQFESLISKNEKVIAHNDFTPDNLLFDPDSGRITALLDYDFSCISHASYEYFCSFLGAGEPFLGWSEDGEDTKLQQAKLHGFPSPLPPTNEDGIKWDVAKAWEEELTKVRAKRPRTIIGIEKIADVDMVLRAISPFRLTNSDVLKLQSEEVIMSYREKSEEKIVKLLEHLGY